MREITSAEMEITRGEDVKEIIIDGYVEYEVDTNYGADADGNRGEKRTIITDVIDIEAWTEGLEDFDLSEEETIKAGEILARKFLQG